MGGIFGVLDPFKGGVVGEEGKYPGEVFCEVPTVRLQRTCDVSSYVEALSPEGHPGGLSLHRDLGGGACRKLSDGASGRV